MSRLRGLLAVLIGLTALAVWQLPPGTGQQLLLALLLWGWPTASWALYLDGALWERPLTAFGLVLLLHAIVTLLLHYLPGPLSRWLLLTAAVLVALLPLLKRPSGLRQQPQRPSRWLWLLALLLAVLLLRLPNMGYKELQGDEGIIMERAAAAIMGQDDVLFLHQKGPMEILLPLLTWRSSGAITEVWARLPLAIAAVFLVPSLAALAYRWLGWRAALITGFLFAINGFAIAFGRILQYQTLVMLWATLSLLHADRYHREREWRDMLLSAAFLAGGLLAHYDAVLFAPAVGWLLWSAQPRQRRHWLAGLGIGGLLLGLFYLPFVLNPNFAATLDYLLTARLGSDTAAVRWSGGEVWQMVTFYNSLYYVVGLLALALLGLRWLRQARLPRLALLLVWLVPLFFYLVIVDDARTHVYTFFPGATLLAALALDRLWPQTMRGQRVAGGLLAMFWLICALYVAQLFLQTTPERQRTWAENRPRGFVTTWTQPPQFGLFGFPYQAGWRVAAELPLALPYASNEEEEVTNYYMGQAARTHCADYGTFLQAQRVQDELPPAPGPVGDWFVQAQITVNGRPTLQLFGPTMPQTVPVIEARERQLWRTPAEVAPVAENGRFPLDVTLGEDQVALLGYDLDLAQAVPGGSVRLRLYWQALQPLAQNYQVFTHLADSELRSQDDGTPECNINPTTRWQPGQIVPDFHEIALDELLTPGSQLRLLVGMYELMSGERLAVPETADNAVYLRTITLRAP